MRTSLIATLLLTLPAFAQTKQATKPAAPVIKPAVRSAAKPAAKPAPIDPVALWSAVSPTATSPKLTPSELTKGQIEDVQSLLLNRTEADGWGCEDDVPATDWLSQLTYFEIDLVPGTRTLYVQAGEACGRSGKNSPNGAMWILRPPTSPNGDLDLIATPEASFNGGLYSIQPTRSHGYPDIVIGWVVNPTESDLTYFRFDGKEYEPIGIAKRMTDSDAPIITPTPIPQEK